MAAKSGLDIPERQVVQTLIANATGSMQKGLANAYCPSVTALYEVAASVKEDMYEFQKIEGDTESIHQVAKQRDSPLQDYRQNGNHSRNDGNARGNYHHTAPQQQSKRPKCTSYPPIPVMLMDMFVEMIEARAIDLLPRRPEGGNCDRSKYCQYHRRRGHNLEDCWVFKDIVYDLVDADVFNWDVLIERAQKHH